MDPNDPTSPAPTPTKGYQGTATDSAMAAAQEAKDHARYLEHGIVMNPDENPNIKK
jgi:hypothetical protein